MDRQYVLIVPLDIIILIPDHQLLPHVRCAQQEHIRLLILPAALWMVAVTVCVHNAPLEPIRQMRVQLRVHHVHLVLLVMLLDPILSRHVPSVNLEHIPILREELIIVLIVLSTVTVRLLVLLSVKFVLLVQVHRIKQQDVLIVQQVRIRIIVVLDV
jgi:hypothetical protein